MKNNKLMPYKDNFFTKILIFFKRLIFRKKDIVQEDNNEIPVYEKREKEIFLENIILKKNNEETRIQKLKEKYDNGEIDEDDLSESDIDKIISLYEKETDELNADTERRKELISQMLKELKQSKLKH